MAVSKRKEDSGKRLHPVTWGCVGCSGIILVMVVVGSVAVRGIIEKMGASEDDLGLSGQRAILERVPGGVVRRELSGGQWLDVNSLAWRNDDSLTYAGMAMPKMSDLMRVATYGGMVPNGDQDEMRRRNTEMAAGLLSAPVREYDFRSRVDQELVSVPENAIVGHRGLGWSPDGKHAAVAIIPPEQIADAEYTPQGDVLYVMSMREAGGWQKLTSGSFPEWSPDGEWIAFRRGGQKDKRGCYVIRSDGSGERRVESTVWGWTSKDGGCVSAYGKSDPDEGRGGLPWQVWHVDLIDGATRQVKVHEKVERMGPLSATERGFAERHRGAKGEAVTWVGAIEPGDGRVRWLSKKVPGRWSVRAEILDGKALLMNGTSDDETEKEHLAVFSMIDGRLRELLSVAGWSGGIVSRDTRIAWVERREETLYGFVPIPVCDIAVLEITRPEELLSGAIVEED
jgi:hypothetical protein